MELRTSWDGAYVPSTGLSHDGSAWFQAGDTYISAGNPRHAIASYEQGLRLRPDFAPGYNSLGIAWQKLSDYARAILCFQQCIRLSPAFAPAHNNLGNALRSLQRWTEAVAAFQQGLALWPDNPDIAYNLGNTYHDLGDLDNAVGCYQKALRHKPAYAAEVSNSLATAYKEQGLFDQAIAQCQETLKLQPNHGRALYNLSEMAAAGRYRFTPNALRSVRSFADSEHTPPAERSLAAFALGNLFDKQGDYDQAFAYYRLANATRKNGLAAAGTAFDAASHEALIERIMAAYGRAHFERAKKWGTATELPVFIIGMPRSGSTLVEQILASHPHVFGAGEIESIHEFIKPLAAEDDGYKTPLVPNIRVARQLAGAYLRRLEQLGKGGRRVTNKNLGNFLHLGLIATLFPGARIIHCRRDPLDTGLSCYFQNFQELAFSCALEDIAAYYRAYERLMAHWSRLLPVPVHEVVYEELVQDQETVSRGLVAFCGLDWDERCLSFFNSRRVVQTASAVQVRKPISSQAIGRWRAYRAHLGPLLEGLGLQGR